jgi:hypothetical protein
VPRALLSCAHETRGGVRARRHLRGARLRPAQQVVLGRGDDAGGAGSRVVGFVLVDVTSGADVRMLADGDTIDTRPMPVTIRANVEPLDPGSVVFELDGRAVRTEENPPWAISGNDPVSGKFFVWNVAAGARRVKATPHAAAAGAGAAGVALEETFVIQ